MLLLFADVFDTEKTLYIILELVTGGELFDAITDAGHFSEDVAKGKQIELGDSFLALFAFQL